MGYLRFLALDAAGVVISVPLSIYLGKKFGDSVEHLQRQFAGLHLILAFLVVSFALMWFVRVRHRERERQVRGLAEQDRPAGAQPAAERADPPPGAAGGAPLGDDPRLPSG